MKAPATVFFSLLLAGGVACDSSQPAAADGKADEKAKADAEYEAKLKKRAEERKKKEEDAKAAEEEIAKKIEEVTVVPDDAKIPKKPADACKEVVEAQRGFMKKFHGDIDEAALTTQLGLIGKQCNEMAAPKVAMCQKFALDATTEELKGKINEYLPVCMKKYGADAGG